MEERTDVKYRLLVIAIPLFMAGYFFLAGLSPLLSVGDGKEKYLLYHWYVFTYVPSRQQVAFEAYVTKIDGKELPVPVPLESSGALFFDDIRNKPEYRGMIGRLGKDLSEGKKTNAELARVELEKFIEKRPLTYEIREIHYNPIDRYLSGTTTSKYVLGSFNVQ